MSKPISSMAELFAALAKLSQEPKEEAPEQSHEEWLEKCIERANTEMRAAEISLAILKAAPPQTGANLVAAEALMPKEPQKHGVLSVVTYALETGSYLVTGTDHLTGFKIEHTSPNEHGVEGLMLAVRHELAKQSAEAYEAEEKALPVEPDTVH